MSNCLSIVEDVTNMVTSLGISLKTMKLNHKRKRIKVGIPQIIPKKNPKEHMGQKNISRSLLLPNPSLVLINQLIKPNPELTKTVSDLSRLLRGIMKKRLQR